MQIFYETYQNLFNCTGCTISGLLIDNFYKSRLISFKEIIDYLIIEINRASLAFCITQ